MDKYQKYIDYALENEILNAKMLHIDDIVFDTRAILKCRYGCNSNRVNSIRCSDNNLSTNEKLSMLKKYKNILLLHCNNAQTISRITLEIEKLAFLDGFYFALAVRSCNLCDKCLDVNCPTPDLIRPCEQNFGIDTYSTVRNQGYPCNVLQSKNDTQNRFGFVFID